MDRATARRVWNGILHRMGIQPTSPPRLDQGVAAMRLGEWGAARAVLAPLAQSGDPEAQYRLAQLYRDGHGVAPDEGAALEWLRRAAERGHADAEVDLAREYESGELLPEDDAEAARWYLEAARGGNGEAQYALGRMYATGRGVPRDPVEAHARMGLAARRLTRERRQAANDDRHRLGALMTPDQLAASEARLRQWLAHWGRHPSQPATDAGNSAARSGEGE